MKKNFKLVLALILAAMMLMTSAMAATVTIEGQNNGGVINSHTFKAYKVLSGNWEGGKLTNITNGDGINWTSSEMLTALSTATSKTITDGASLAAALEGMNDAKEIASILQKYVVGNGTVISNGGTLGDGYYIIIDTTTIGADEVKNAALLQVAGDNVVIQVKTSKTTIDKKIDAVHDADTTNDNATGGVVEANNGQVGDLVPYIITATIADTTYYKKYYFEMNDTVSAGLDISAKDAVSPNNFSDYVVEVSCETSDPDDTNSDGFKTLAAAKYTLTVDATNRTIKLVIDDAKEFGGKQIRLTYKAKINENAVTGEAGNPNTVNLKYSNNPDHSGDGEYRDTNYTTTTPNEVVKTFVTAIELLKIDLKDSTKKLEGAIFEISGTRTLSTVVTEFGFVEDDNGTWYKLDDGSYTETAPGTDGGPTNYDTTVSGKKFKKGNTTTVKTEQSNVKVQGTTDKDGNLKFDKLGEGTYTIKEIKAPDGYNLLPADKPISFTINCTEPASISAAGTETCTWNSTNLINIDNVTYDNGVFKITVKNAQGSTLPETGGIGTTIFYIGGSILVLAAAILLITKRRMSSND